MDKISELIKTFLPLPIALPLILHIAILAGIWFAPHLEELLPPNLYQAHGRVPILTISLSVLLLYLLMLVSYIVLYFKFQNKLTPKFGVKWDKNKEAYCPACDVPLSNSHADGDYHQYSCIKCGKDPYLSHLGKQISLSDALKILNDKNS